MFGDRTILLTAFGVRLDHDSQMQQNKEKLKLNYDEMKRFLC